MALDPTVIVAAVTAWGSILGVAVKGALDARAAKAQTNGMLHGPLGEMRSDLSDLKADVRDVKADIRSLKRGAAADRVTSAESHPHPSS